MYFFFEACAFLTFEWEMVEARKGSTIRWSSKCFSGVLERVLQRSSLSVLWIEHRVSLKLQSGLVRSLGSLGCPNQGEIEDAPGLRFYLMRGFFGPFRSRWCRDHKADPLLILSLYFLSLSLSLFFFFCFGFGFGGFCLFGFGFCMYFSFWGMRFPYFRVGNSWGKKRINN